MRYFYCHLLPPVVTPIGKRFRLPMLPKLRPDVAFAASRRNNRRVATQQQIRRDVIHYKPFS